MLGNVFKLTPRFYALRGLRSSPCQRGLPRLRRFGPRLHLLDGSVHFQTVAPVQFTTGGETHAPETPLLLGNAGWWPPGLPFDSAQIVGTHRTAANPRMCATCHVQSYDVTDPATGNFVFHATGHLFLAVPCLNDKGVPTADTTCTIDQRQFAACATSGCHGTPGAARSAFLVATQRIADLNAQLKAMLAQVPASQFNPADSVYTTAEGAKFNTGLADLPGSPVHNPFLMEALLTASIKQVNREYGVTIPSGVVVANILRH